jgi:hypothetical protein
MFDCDTPKATSPKREGSNETRMDAGRGYLEVVEGGVVWKEAEGGKGQYS